MNSDLQNRMINTAGYLRAWRSESCKREGYPTSMLTLVGFEVLKAIVMNVTIFYRVVGIRADVSEERITSIFRFENQLSKKPECGR
jgi:hypothetical protein